MEIVNRVTPIEPFEIGRTVQKIDDEYRQGITYNGLYPELLINSDYKKYALLDFGNDEDYGIVFEASKTLNSDYTDGEYNIVIRHIKKYENKLREVNSYKFKGQFNYVYSCNLNLNKAVLVFSDIDDNNKPKAMYITLNNDVLEFSNVYEVDPGGIQTTYFHFKIKKISQDKFIIIFQNANKVYGIIGNLLDEDLVFGTKTQLFSYKLKTADLIKINENSFLIGGQTDSSPYNLRFNIVNIVGVNISTGNELAVDSFNKSGDRSFKIERITDNEFIVGQLNSSHKIQLIKLSINMNNPAPISIHANITAKDENDTEISTNYSYINLFTNKNKEIILCTPNTRNRCPSIFKFDEYLTLIYSGWDMFGGNINDEQMYCYQYQIQISENEYLLAKGKEDTTVRIVNVDEIGTIGKPLGIAIAQDTYISKGLGTFEGINLIPGRKVYLDENGRLTHNPHYSYTSTKDHIMYNDLDFTMYNSYIGYAISYNEVLITEDIREFYKYREVI